MIHTKSILLFLSLSFFLLVSCGRPIAKFTYDDSPKAATPIQFENESEKAERFEWDFGDGNTSEEVAPSHRYMSSGNYLVRMKAINSKNKVQEKKMRIVVDAPELCLIELKTPYGSILIQLYDSTPKHQDNFVKLAEQHFFDSLLFHRVIQGFMVQGGDPQSKNAREGMPLGMGGPGYTIPAEFVDSLVHIRGAIAAARLPDNVNPKRNSSGSQFYIVQGRPVTESDLDKLEAQKGQRYSQAQRDAYLKYGGTPFLDRDYTVFGRVLEGMDIIDKIAAIKTDGRDRPIEDIWMIIRPIH
ncbi:MAG: peptidylprolyl isomerase [Saprospiraceae bacterium]|nr:peptidylprolyl isomerase [Saprospiraceae bacterium]MCB9326615.1 peptidylprolyl isomerase [Lewinellaceae bacterium]